MPGYYNVDGEIYPSVTTVLQKMLPEPPGIRFWKLRTPNWEKELRYKAIMGTMVHYRILNPLAIRTLELPDMTIEDIPEDIQHILEIADVMWNKFEFNIGHPRTIETIHVNKREKYVGTPDLIAPFDGVYTLVDIKTSKDIHDRHKLQVGAYYNMLDKKPDRAYLISIHPYEKKNPRLEGHVVEMTKEELEKNATEFLDIVRLYHRVHSVKKKGKVTRLLARPSINPEIEVVNSEDIGDDLL